MPIPQHIHTIAKAAQAILAHDMTLPHAVILFASAEESPTMGEIAKLLRCTTSNVTGQIDRMEKMGLVTRAFSKDDRRSIRVSITDKGLAKLNLINAAFDTL